MARHSAGSRDAWSSAHARSVPARSWAMRARRRCRRCSISRSSIGSPSASSLSTEGANGRKDSRYLTMQKMLNLKVKYRESFRPFAPSVLSEDAAGWFDLDVESPYMLLVADVAREHRIAMSEQQNRLFGIDKLNIPRSSIPAVTHVDYSARVQTVHRETNPRYHALIKRFKGRTGCPVIVNTSFNVRGEPIVCAPEDAFRCFMGTEIEALAVGNCFLKKEMQNAALSQNYESRFELD